MKWQQQVSSLIIRVVFNHMPDTTDLNAFNVSLNKIFHSFIIFFQYPSIIFIMVIPNNLIISLCEFVDENG